jgi:hypothetical protein
LAPLAHAQHHRASRNLRRKKSVPVSFSKRRGSEVERPVLEAQGGPVVIKQLSPQAKSSCRWLLISYFLNTTSLAVRADSFLCAHPHQRKCFSNSGEYHPVVLRTWHSWRRSFTRTCSLSGICSLFVRLIACRAGPYSVERWTLNRAARRAAGGGSPPALLRT